jgi:hypothetical protein
MEGRFLDRIMNAFELDLPDKASMEKYIDFIIPKVGAWGSNLKDVKLYTNKRWREIRDTDTFHEVVLHIFMPNGEYMVVIDGDISKGIWQYLPETNTFILDYGGKSQLFELTFLNADFFILQKHGDQGRKGKEKYRVYGTEKMVKKLDWRACMEELYNIYRNNSKFGMWVMMIVLFIAGFIILNLL